MKILYVCAPGDETEHITACRLADMFAKVMPPHDFSAPELPEDPLETNYFLCEKAAEFDPDLIVGSRLGGFYAMLIPGAKKLIIDPSLSPHELVDPTGEGERKRKELTILHDRFFDPWNDLEWMDEVWGLFGEEGEKSADALKFKKEFRKDRFFSASFSLPPDERRIKNIFVPLIERILADHHPPVTFSDMDESCLV